MKKLALYSLVILISLVSLFCNTENENTKDDEKVEKAVTTDKLVKADKLEVYYFHHTRRCMTCNAVESVTKEALQEHYSKEMASGKITFVSINIDEESSNEIAEKLNVSSQTLLFVAGDNRINLTNDGFMYAAKNPEKLKEKVKSTVGDLLI